MYKKYAYIRKLVLKRLLYSFFQGATGRNRLETNNIDR